LKKIDGYDQAIIGPAYVWHGNERVNVLIYNAEAIRYVLVKRDGMDPEEAREFIEFNIEGAYMGPDTPLLVWPSDFFWLTPNA
jgi:hypothetical protein